jgi:hypothetical protein
MQKITAYEVVGSSETAELEEKVNKKLALGWIPLGGICVWLDKEQDPTKTTRILIQAMIKLAPETHVMFSR